MERIPTHGANLETLIKVCHSYLVDRVKLSFCKWFLGKKFGSSCSFYEWEVQHLLCWYSKGRWGCGAWIFQVLVERYLLGYSLIAGFSSPSCWWLHWLWWLVFGSFVFFMLLLFYIVFLIFLWVLLILLICIMTFFTHFFLYILIHVLMP
jgi:hypothetical protein